MKCKQVKPDGQQCQANAMNGSEFCYLHNPAISDEDKREAQIKGGANRALTLSKPLPAIPVAVPDDAILLITDTIARVRAGELDIKTANCIGFLTDKLLKAFEVAKLNDKTEFVRQVVLEKRTNY